MMKANLISRSMLRIFLLLSILMCPFIICGGCTVASRPDSPSTPRFTRLQTEQAQAPGGILLIDASAVVKRGENGIVTIQGRPGVTYNITATYRRGNNVMNALQSKNAGNDGLVTWTWAVSRDTVPGTYQITIYGGGQSFITTYTVTE